MALQIIGGALVLLSLAAYVTGRLSPASPSLLVASLIGAALLSASAVVERLWVFAVVAGACVLVVAAALLTRLSRGSPPPEPSTPADARRDAPRTPRFLEVGHEPDPRFSLANERTFLAWTRTALGLLVAGLAVVQFSTSLPHGVRLAIGLPLIAVAALTGVRAYPQWRSVELALRLSRPLPVPRLLAAPSFVVGVVALCTFVAVVVYR